MIKSSTFDPSKRLDLYFRINREGSKRFTFIDANDDEYDITGIDFELFIKDYAGARDKRISLTIGDGLEIPAYEVNILDADVTALETFINEGEYYWELYLTDQKKTWLSGKAFFHNGEFDGVNNDSETLTIAEGGDIIEITISDSSGSGSSSATPTLQQVLTAGSTLTGTNTITGDVINVESTNGGSVRGTSTSAVVFDAFGNINLEYGALSINGDPGDPGDVLTTSGWTAPGAGAVSSVFSRTGAVTAQSGDYTATQVTNTPAGTIAATTVQAAINELDTEKAPLASPTFTGTPSLPTGTTAVTQSAGDNSTKLATTAYVDDAVLLTEAYGQIFSASSFAGTTGFTNNGTTVSVVSNTLEFISGAATVAQTLDYDYVTALEYWKQEGTFKVLEKDADSYGFGLGINSANTYAQFEVFGRFDMTTGANTGKVLFTNDQNTDIATSTAALTFSVNDEIKLTVERFENVVIVTAKNITTDADAVSVQYNYSDFPNQHPYQPNTGKFAILSRGGQFQLSALTISSSEVKNAEVMLVGDSKVVGYNVTSQNSRIATLLKNNIASVVVNGGGSDRTADVLLRTTEIIALAPKRVLLAIGSNDIRSGVAEATYEANYDNITTTLEAAGITVIHLLPFRELVLNQIPLRDHITATYTADEIIDTYSVLTNAMIDASIHPTTIGNYNLYNKIITSNKLGALRTSPYAFSPTGTILYAGYKAPASDLNFTYDGLGLMIGAPVATRNASSIMHAYISTNAGRYVLSENASTGTASFIGFSMKSGARQSFLYQTPTTYTNANFSDASVWQSHFNTNLVMTTDGSNAHLKVGLNGKLTVYNTVTGAGTTGAQTINKASGTVNFAAAAASLVVTNSLVTTSSIIFCTVRTNDATAVIKNVVPASGSFTINLEAAATAETSVGFLVIN